MNVTDKDCRTALHYAVEKGDCERKTFWKSVINTNELIVGDEKIVNMLIEHGAKINVQDTEGRTSLHFANQRGSYLSC